MRPLVRRHGRGLCMSSLARRCGDKVTTPLRSRWPGIHAAASCRRRPSSSTPASSVGDREDLAAQLSASPLLSDSLREKVLCSPKLHRRVGHPLHLIKAVIEQYFDERHAKDAAACSGSGSAASGGLGTFPQFMYFDDMPAVVSTQANFDDLLIPIDHVSRSENDTFYVDAAKACVLRTHTSAHQTELMRRGERAFLCTGDVYRRDTIDRSHYPVFHQMEGVRIFGGDGNGTAPDSEILEQDLKDTLDGLARALFGEDVQMRWNTDYFPFTNPSWELEIFFDGAWMEVLGCGVIEQQIVDDCNLGEGARGWAFGLGLESPRLLGCCCHLCGLHVPDIRLFWTDDDRFHRQFRGALPPTTAGPGGTLWPPQFKAYSKFPPCLKDISFWLPEHQNKMTLVDEFTHPKTGKVSHCYRIVYRSPDRSLTNAEVDELQFAVRDQVVDIFGVELR